MKNLLKVSLATFCVELLCLTFSLAAQTPTIPDTPAGRTLQAWLDAFNSGDRGRLEAYFKKYDPEKSVDSELNFRNQTGGFELVRIAQSDRLHTTVPVLILSVVSAALVFVGATFGGSLVYDYQFNVESLDGTTVWDETETDQLPSDKPQSAW